MKKCFTYVIMPIISVVIAASILFAVASYKFSREYNVYKFSPAVCAGVFSKTPEEFVETSLLDCTYKKVDREGNLIIVMTDDEVDSWGWLYWDNELIRRLQGKGRDPNFVESIINNPMAIYAINDAETSGVKVSEDCTQVVYEGDVDPFFLAFVLPACLLRQTVSGVDFDKVKIEFTFYDKYGEVEYQSTFPGDDVIYPGKNALGENIGTEE